MDGGTSNLDVLFWSSNLTQGLDANHGKAWQQSHYNQTWRWLPGIQFAFEREYSWKWRNLRTNGSQGRLHENPIKTKMSNGSEWPDFEGKNK